MKTLNINSRRLLLILLPLVGVVLLSCRTTVRYGVPWSTQAETLVGNWIGLTEFDGAYYKLVLEAGRSGTLYGLYPTGKIAEYQIYRWSVHENKLRCEFAQHGPPGKPSRLESEVRNTHMIGKLVGIGEWTESILFRREKPFEENLSKLFAVGKK